MRSPSLSAQPAAHGSPAPTNGGSHNQGQASDPALGQARARLEAVRLRIREACTAAGRSPDAVQLLAVSKTFGIGEIQVLATLGQTAFGENYLQEALGKIGAAGDTGRLSPGQQTGHALQWHFIGPLQSNKTRPVAENFDWVHSVDRLKVATRLSEQRPPERGALQVCLQVDVSNEDSKSGCAAADAPELAVLIAALPGLVLRGIMAIPAPTDDPAIQRAQFRRVREVYEVVRRALPESAAARFDTLSMGMSGDLEAAILEGATLVRVGTALFGARPARP